MYNIYNRSLKQFTENASFVIKLDGIWEMLNIFSLDIFSLDNVTN